MYKKISKHITNIKNLMSLVRGVFSKFYITLSYALMYIAYKLHIPIFPLKLRCEKFDKNFICYVYNFIDITVLIDIFLEEEYRINLESQPHIIFDLGSNNGLSVIYFRLKYPDAHIYAFEPVPNSFAKLKKNIKQFSNVTAFNYAIGGTDGEEDFFSYKDSSLSSSLHMRSDKNKDDVEKFRVIQKSLDSILGDLSVSNIDLLKFDIEGAEYEVFKNFKNLQNTSALIGEVHTDLFPQDATEFIKLLSLFELETEVYDRSDRYLIKGVKK